MNCPRCKDPDPMSVTIQCVMFGTTRVGVMACRCGYSASAEWDSYAREQATLMERFYENLHGRLDELELACAQAVEFATYVEQHAKGKMEDAAKRFLSLEFAQELAGRLHPTATPPRAAMGATQQPEARVGGEDFHDTLYGAKVKLYLDPENDESSVELQVGATFGPNDKLEIMLHAVDGDGNVVKLYTAPPAQQPDNQDKPR